MDCTTWGMGGISGQKVYAEGATADSPLKALDVARSERAFDGVQDGLKVAAQEPDRVLYVAEVDGVIKQAVIVHDGPATEGAGGPVGTSSRGHAVTSPSCPAATSTRSASRSGPTRPVRRRPPGWCTPTQVLRTVRGGR